MMLVLSSLAILILGIFLIKLDIEKFKTGFFTASGLVLSFLGIYILVVEWMRLVL